MHPVLKLLIEILSQKKLNQQQIQMAKDLIHFITLLETSKKPEEELYQDLSKLIGQEIKPAGPININAAANEKGRTVLIQAAYNGHTKFVRLLLEAKANPNQPNEISGAIPLVSAAAEGKIKTVKLLLKAKADPNQDNIKYNGYTPLWWSAREGRIEVTRLLLDAKATLHQVVRETGTTPLMEAINARHLKVAQLLLNAKANPEQYNEKMGETPLISAVQSKQIRMVKRLLNANANPDQMDEKIASTPLIKAIEKNLTKMIYCLLKAKANPNQEVKKNSLTPLERAAEEGKTDIVQLLLNVKASPLHVTEKTNEKAGEVAAAHACYFGHTESLRLLLKAKVDPNLARKSNGQTLLNYASEKGHLEMIDLLIEEKANISQSNKITGDTPIMMAALYNRLASAERLLNAGADPCQIRKETGATSLKIACQQGFTQMVSLLLDAKAIIDQGINQVYEKHNEPPLYLAAERGHKDTVHLLLQRNADPDSVNPVTGRSTLAVAAWNNHLVVVDLLIKANANPDIATDKVGYRPLTEAIAGSHSEVVTYLLDAKANPELENKITGDTPLMVAANHLSNPSTEIVMSLLDAKAANHDQKNPRTHATPLMYAAYRNNANIVKGLLEEKTSTINVVTKSGCTALDYAISGHHLPMVSLLLMQGAIVIDFKRLQDFLETSDPFDDDFLTGIKALHLPLRTTADAKLHQDIPAELKEDALKYLEKLTDLQNYLKESHENTKKYIENSINEGAERPLPKVLTRIILEYDNREYLKPSTKITFFKPATIDPAIEEIKTYVAGIAKP